MKALLCSCSRRRSLFVFLGLTVLCGLFLSACDFNVELTDEKRVLEKIEGVPDCNASNRAPKGKSGSIKFRLFLVDNRKEAIVLNGIDEAPFNLTKENLSIDKGTIKVLSTETGEVVAGATATVAVTGNLNVQANPRFSELKQAIGNRRVPKAIALMIDMSDTAGDQDSKRTRTSAAATWILDNFNSDASRGDLDIFYTLLIKNDRLSSEDNMFKTRTERAYIDGQGKKRGFLLTTEDTKTTPVVPGNKTIVSEEFTRLSPAKVGGKPPLYEGIEAAALDLRAVSRESGEGLFNPNAIAISLERDVTLLDSKGNTKLNAALQAVKGKSIQNGNDETVPDFVPLQAIVYPLPNTTPETKREDWDKHLDNLCQLAQAGGINKNTYWGNVMQVLPSLRRAYQPSTRGQLDVAYHSMKGYIETTMSYTLGGNVEAGKRYIISFRMLGKLLGEEVKVDPDNPDSLPVIHFEVQN